MIEVTERELLCWIGGSRLKSERVSCWVKRPTESGYVLGGPWKHIVVFSPSQHIENFPSSLNIENVLGTNSRGSLWNCATHESQSWGDQAVANVIGGIVKVEIPRQLSITKFSPRMDSQIFGWSSTTVLPLRAETPSIQSSFWNELPKREDIYWEDESAQLCIGDVLHRLNSFLGIFSIDFRGFRAALSGTGEVRGVFSTFLHQP